MSSTTRHIAILEAILSRRGGPAIAALFAVACGTGDPSSEVAPSPPIALYVGMLDASDAQIAVVRNDTRWAAYVCGGPSSFDVATEWFQGTFAEPASAGTVEGTSENKTLHATFTDEAASGTLTMDGSDSGFIAERVPDGSPAGLFNAVTSGCRTGLIVPPPGQAEPQGVYCADAVAAGQAVARSFKQVTPILPIGRVDRAVSVRVVIAGEERILSLSPVALPLDSG